MLLNSKRHIDRRGAYDIWGGEVEMSNNETVHFN